MGGSLTDEADHPTYTEIFEEAEAWYLSVGMSLDEYWNGEPRLARVYREAEMHRLHRQNTAMHRMGVYMTHAIAATVGNAFKKKGQQPAKYPEEPLPLTQKEADAQRVRKEEEREERLMQKMYALMGVKKGAGTKH